MILKQVFDRCLKRFENKSPVCVMLRGVMEFALDPKGIDAVFDSTAKRQYTDVIRFSDLVDLLGLVVGQVFPTLGAGYSKHELHERVSRQAVYGKLRKVEPQVLEALVRHSGQRCAEVVAELQKRSGHKRLFPGIVTKIVDGNHLAATDKRLDVLRDVAAGALPGHALVVYDADTRLVSDVYCCLDGHAQERTLLWDLVKKQKPGELYIVDRAGCTSEFLTGTIKNEAFFLVRQHANNAPWRPLGRLRKKKTESDGVIYEQKVMLRTFDGREHQARRIVKKLHAPLRDGSRQLPLLTNLPREIRATQAMSGYQNRRTIENVFGELASGLNCEIASLGYPPAALSAFAVGLVIYNLLSVVRTALAREHGWKEVDELSSYHLAVDFRATMAGMLVAIPAETWTTQFGGLTACEMAKELRRLASKVRFEDYRKAHRGPKQPRAKPSAYKEKTHVSTARLINAAADA